MTTSIGFTPALPCATIQGDRMCGKPATAGTLYPLTGGLWLLQPFCRDCTAALLWVYGGDAELFPPAAASTSAADAERQAEQAIGIVGKLKRMMEDGRP